MKYIFEVTVKDGHSAEEYADAWVRASELIQQAPGARGTELHRKIGEPNKLIAIASWDSKMTAMPWMPGRTRGSRRSLKAPLRLLRFGLWVNLKTLNGWYCRQARIATD